MPRLGSKKSRYGCKQCKVRRVKVKLPLPSSLGFTHPVQCDENRPCGACARYRVECSLLSNATSDRSDVPSPITQASSDEPSASTASPPNEASHPPDICHSGSVQEHPTLVQNSTPPGLTEHLTPADLSEITPSQWMFDLELMHHFTAHAYLTMPGVEQTKQIWGYAVPQEAFKFPFLMHSLLAFSANHLAHINPSRTSHFRLQSSTHQAAAVTSLNKALTNIGPDNCHALFVGASLTVVNAFADVRTYDLDILIEIFKLIRGMEYVLGKATPMIEKGPFATIVRPVGGPPRPSPLLSAFLVDVQGLAYPRSSEPTPVELACIKAAEILRQGLQYSLESAPHPAMRAAMIWPISIDSDFIELLKQRTDPAVREVFKHYCRLLEYSGTDFWFFHRWRGVSHLL